MIYAELFFLTILAMAGLLGYTWWEHLDYSMAKLVRAPQANWDSFTQALRSASLQNARNLLSEWPLFLVGLAAAVLEGLTQRQRFPWSGYGRRLWRLSQMLLSVALLGLLMCVLWPTPVRAVVVYAEVVSIAGIIGALTFSYPRVG